MYAGSSSLELDMTSYYESLCGISSLFFFTQISMDSDEDESFIIPAEKLRRISDRTEETKLRIYNKILKRVFQRIKMISVAKGEKCKFEIPEVLLGEPSFDKEQCLIYITIRLEKAGYIVKRRSSKDHGIKISWGDGVSKKEIITKITHTKLKRIEEKKQEPKKEEPKPFYYPPTSAPFYNLETREDIIRALEKK